MHYLIVGLGNPGSRYVGTRHNAGFQFLEQIQAVSTSEIKLLTKSVSDSSYTNFRNWGKSEISEHSTTADKVTILKPQTFMNLSGEAVLEYAQFKKIPLEQIIVIHDELDLPPGTVRIKQGGSDGGHNGLKSITQLCGNPNYYRMRVGIGRPPGGPGQDVSPWVLGRFSSVELDLVLKSQGKALNALNIMLQARFSKISIAKAQASLIPEKLPETK